MIRNSALMRWYVRFVGSLTAATLGKWDHYTPEHRSFLASGFVCQGCKQLLLTRYLVADVKCYDADGNQISMMYARSKGRYFECPKCKYQWTLRLVTRPTAG